MAVSPGQFSRTRAGPSPGRAHCWPAVGDQRCRLSVTLRRGGAVGSLQPGGLSEPLRRDESLLDVTLPRLEVLHAPLRLFACQVQFLGDEVDALRAVELLVVGDAGRLQLNVVCAHPLLLNVLSRLLAA